MNSQLAVSLQEYIIWRTINFTMCLLLFRTTICNLYTMPRIGEPVWLTMMSGTPEKNQLCHRFMKEFTFLMENASKNQYGLLYLVTYVILLLLYIYFESKFNYEIGITLCVYNYFFKNVYVFCLYVCFCEGVGSWSYLQL